MATPPPAATASALPKSGAVSKGYNFASTWEQVGRHAFASGRSGRGWARDLAGAIGCFMDLTLYLFGHSGPFTERAAHGAAEGRDRRALPRRGGAAIPAQPGEAQHLRTVIFV
jgi:hypothetical protein